MKRTSRVPEWTLGDRLRKIRIEGGFGTQAEFAELIGANLQQYGAWESGRNRPRDIVALAKRIELLARVPAEWTLGLDEDIHVEARHLE